MVKGFRNYSIVEWFMVLKSQPLPLSEWLKSYLKLIISLTFDFNGMIYGLSNT